MSERRGFGGSLRTVTALVVTALIAGLAASTAGPGQAATADDLLVSRSADRSGAVPLANQALTGTVYVFVAEGTGASQVSFWLDDPNRVGAATKIEKNSPWDFRGSAVNGLALPWDTAQLSPGTHSIVAQLVLPGGALSTVSASFTTGAISGSIAASPSSISLNASVDGPAVTRSIDVSSTPTGATVAVALSGQSWLTSTATAIQAPGALTVRIDPAGLPAGAYTSSVTLSSPSLSPATVAITLNVTAGAGTYQLRGSAHPGRHDAFQLDGSTVTGGLHVFTNPDDAVVQVRFWIDRPSRSGTPYRTEKTPPFDLNGGSVTLATPYDTRLLADGSHVVSAELTLASGALVVLDATFTVANAVGAPALTFAPASLAVDTVAGGDPVTRSVRLSASDASAKAVTFSSNLPWVSASAQGPTPTDVVVRIEVGAIPAGTYPARITAASAGTTSALLDVVVTVTGDGGPGSPYSLRVSTRNDRSGATALEGSRLRGSVYVFVAPESGLRQVEFFVDDPTMTGPPAKLEGNAPWDLAGGTAAGIANPYDTARLLDGPHTVTARLTPPTGLATAVTATFNVLNGQPGLAVTPAAVDVAASPGGSAEVQLDLVVTDGAAVQPVITAGASWVTVVSPPGTTPTTATLRLDGANLGEGTHQTSVTVSAVGLDPVVVPVTLRTSLVSPDQLHLSFTGNAATTLTLAWRTRMSGPSWVEYRPAGTSNWLRAEGNPRASGTTGQLWTASLTGLTPGGAYEYRAAQAGITTAVHPAHTVAPTGPTSAAFFADTGIIGRLDGLAVATAQTVQILRDLRADVLLGAGDFAYYNTDKRFATLDDAIDAWFAQMEPAAAEVPLMPSYGNHETLLGEQFEPWAARLPTPSGWSNSRAYSFDVGPFHFISLYAVANTTALTSTQITWLRNDISAARAAGRPWIIPFMHVSSFAAGTNHPSNVNLRKQLGPIFESNQIRLVMQAHDQAYQRTWPITGLPTAITPRTGNLGCVSPGDGVVWVTVSPAGKLSNISRTFSPYAQTPPPPWSAVRDNTKHHVARLAATAGGDLTVNVLGYDGSGAAPVTTDQFRLARSTCA